MEEHQQTAPKQNKNLLMIGIGAVVLVAIIGGIFVFGGSKKKTTKPEVKEEIEDEIIPTVDPSVVVELEPVKGNKELTITVDKIPNGTDTIDYEMSYETEEQGLQGILGTLTVEKGASQVEKTVTLGTCSSGSCVYHKVKGAIKASMKFNGTYGERIFEKEYTL